MERIALAAEDEVRDRFEVPARTMCAVAGLPAEDVELLRGTGDAAHGSAAHQRRFGSTSTNVNPPERSFRNSPLSGSPSWALTRLI